MKNMKNNRIRSVSIKRYDSIRIYRRLPQPHSKRYRFLRWAQNKCSDTKYIMKTDDDIILNVEQLVNNLKSFKSGITGALIPKRKPNRTIGYKWYIPESTYPDESFRPPDGWRVYNHNRYNQTTDANNRSIMRSCPSFRTFVHLWNNLRKRWY
jgi:hypothetical protein